MREGQKLMVRSGGKVGKKRKTNNLLKPSYTCADPKLKTPLCLIVHCLIVHCLIIVGESFLDALNIVTGECRALL